MNFSAEETDITYGIELNIQRALLKAIENNNKETLRVLNAFNRRVISSSISEKSLTTFRKYIFIPTHTYVMSFEARRNNSLFEEIHKTCAQYSIDVLKGIIDFEIKYQFGNKLEVIERKKQNEFYYLAFCAFSRLLFQMLRCNDYSKFYDALDDFGLISDRSSNEIYKLRFEIRHKKSENEDGPEIAALEERLEVSKKFDRYRRHVLLGIKYWILKLYSVKELDEETAVELISKVKIPTTDNDAPLEDILFFQNIGFSDYMEWRDWDYLDRRLGVVYSPPSPNDWVVFGFLLEQLKGERPLSNVNIDHIEDLSRVSFLYQKLSEFSVRIINDFDRWKAILEVKNKSILQQRADQILTLFATLKRKGIGVSEKEIARAKLSESKIKEFRSLIGKAWNSQSRVKSIFKKLGVSENLPSEDKVMLRKVGRRMFLNGGKIMFIKGKHYQAIYGSDQMGGEIGRWEDTEFFSSVLQSDHDVVVGSSVLSTLNKAIAELKSREVIPDLIFLSPYYSYRDRELLESKLFTPKKVVEETMNDTDDNISQYYIGEFDSIPVYSSFSELLENKVLVCDFRRAFKMRYKTNPSWYKEELNIEVSEVSQKQAEMELAKNSHKWKITEDEIQLSDEDAIELIKNSININIWSTLDFKIEEIEAFTIGHIRSSDKLKAESFN